MQTCINMFKSHPNVNNIKFTLLPLAREVMQGSQDIPQDVYALMERFGRDKPDAQGLVFDFSVLLSTCGDL